MRVDNWHVALADYLSGVSGEFAFGTADCCQFVAGAVQAITGEDRRNLFPAYTTEAQANAILGQHGGLQGLVTHALGEPMHPSMMQRGDVCLVPDSRGVLCVGVCTGTTIAVRSQSDVERSPRKDAVVAWAVR